MKLKTAITVSEDEKNVIKNLSDFFYKMPDDYCKEMERIFYDNYQYDIDIYSICDFLHLLKDFIEVEE